MNQVERIVKALDTNTDGVVSAQEVKVLFARLLKVDEALIH